MSTNETKTDDQNEQKESVTTSDDKNETNDEKTGELSKDRAIMRSYLRRASIGSLLSVILMSILAYLVFDENNNIHISGKINVFQLSSYLNKLEFVLCYQTIGISWILLNMFYVISVRVTTLSIDPMAGHERLTLKSTNIMHNSIEQFIMSAFAQIISISFLEVDLLIKTIPLMNLLFLIGRIAFCFGYPSYRTFGFMCTAIPNTILINYNLYKFVQNLFF